LPFLIDKSTPLKVPSIVENGPRRTGYQWRICTLCTLLAEAIRGPAANSNGLFCTTSDGIRALLCATALLPLLAARYPLLAEIGTPPARDVHAQYLLRSRRIPSNMPPAFCFCSFPLPSLLSPDPWPTAKKTNVNLFACALCTLSVL
jgi:hypothetical protein